MTAQQIFQNLMLVIGGLALFLYGIDLMSTSLKNAAGNKLRTIIEKTTNARWKGILVGIALTGLIQSSSAVTVLIIGLVSVDLMNLRQAAAVVIGANIGTTVTSILIGLPVASWGLWFVAIGVLVFFIFSRKVPRNVGRSVIGFGLLFIGLQFLAEGVIVVAEAEWAQNTLRALSDPSIPGFWLYGFGFSTGFTVIIQSSSAAVGVIQKLYAIGTVDQPTISLIGAIPMVLGANVGTTITGILASIKANKNAKRVALIHVFYNMLGTILILPLISPISKVLTTIETNYFGDNKMMTIAIVHILINVASLLVFVWIITPVVKLVTIIVKDKENKDELSQLLDETLLLGTPSIALSYVKSGIFMMSDIVYEQLQVVKQYHLENKTKLYELAIDLENKIDNYDQRLHKYMIDLVQKNELLEVDSNLLSSYLDIISDLERVGDHLTNIAEFIKQRYDLNQGTCEEELIELSQFYDLIESMMVKSFGSFARKDLDLALEVLDDEIQADIYEKNFKQKYNERLKSGDVEFFAECNYIDILSNLERIGDHLTNVSETVIFAYQQHPKKEQVLTK